MKTLTMIEMQGCPYCANAHRAIDALRAEGGAYAAVPVDFVDENRENAAGAIQLTARPVVAYRPNICPS
ncbi:MAG: hypothetical protein ACFNUC_09015, partial [Selenomonas noxia]